MAGCGAFSCTGVELKQALQLRHSEKFGWLLSGEKAILSKRVFLLESLLGMLIWDKGFVVA